MIEVTQHPSPNFGPRRDGLKPTLIVLHHTAMASAKAAIDRLCDPQAQVSAHYVIARDGSVTQLVPEELRAWHAGEGEWAGLSDINSRSIGIEMDNDGKCPFPEPLMTSLEQLMRVTMARHSIPPSGVIGHSDMAPGRKHDPGTRFDWLRLERLGLARSRGQVRGQDTDSAIPDAATFRRLARDAGFTAPADDATLLAAMRLRFRAHATGPLSQADLIAFRRA